MSSPAMARPLRFDEALARHGQAVEQRGGPPLVVAACALEREHPVADRLEPDLIGPEHRAAAVDRPAVAVDPDDVDIARANGDLLLEDLRALVHHRVEQPLEDLLVGDRATLEALLSGDLEDDLLDLRVGL